MKSKKLPEMLVGLGLVVVALVVYLITLSQGAFPGVSAALVTSHSGLFPRFTPASPLWTALVGLVRVVSGGHFVQALNLISAIFAAASVWLLYSLMVEGLSIFIDALNFTVGRKRLATILSGGGTPLF